MGFYGDVKPGDAFKPSAALENDVRHFLNRLNGFSGGPITAGNPGIIRIPVYNTTSNVLQVGKAVSIDISGIIAGECYPVIAFSNTLPCYGVLVKDLDPAEAGDCILSGLAVVQIASTPATGNYASPGTGGVFVRGNEGVPILNVSETAAVVMLGNVKTAGGGGGSYGIAANVTGGTASVSLVPGGTASSFLVVPGTPNVHISGGSNGEMIVGVTGGTGTFFPPFYYNMGADVTLNQWYSFDTNGWVIGHVMSYQSSNWHLPLQAQIVRIDSVSDNPYLIDLIFPLPQNSIFDYYRHSVPISIPVPAGYKIRFDGDSNDFDITANIFNNYD